MKTKAAVLYQLNSPLKIETLEIPKLKKGQVLVKIMASGICRSQLNEISGYKGVDKYLPHLLGHEGAGIVENIGKGVTKVKKGDHVVLSWIKSIGLESNGSKYKFGNKIINSGAVSTFSEYAVVSENRLVKISKKIPFHIASLLGCAVPTGAGIVFNTVKPKSGESLVIFGVGGVGMSAVLAAKLLKCQPLIAVDINKKALQLSKSLGATHTLLFSDDLRQKLKKIVPYGFDYAIEASGNSSAMEMAFSVIKNSGKAVIAGNLKKGKQISIDPFELIKGKQIVGTWGGETEPDKDIHFYAEQYLTKKLPLEKCISRKFSLNEINEALKLLAENKNNGRIIIEFD